MVKPSEDPGEDAPGLRRRTLLSAGTGAAAAIAGLGAFTGSAAAWERFDADFRGCGEVRVLVGEADFTAYDEALEVEVLVAEGDEVGCRTVELTEDNRTYVPWRYGDSPIVKYRASSDEVIIGVIARTPTGGLHPCRLIENGNVCAQTSDTPSVEEADCYPDPGTYSPDGCGDGEDGEGSSGGRRIIDEPTTITEPGRYALAADLEASDGGTAIEIAADDVVLDGWDHTIDGGGTGLRGVAAGAMHSADLRNVTVRDLHVTGFEGAGIAFEGVVAGAVEDVSITDSGRGIEFRTVRNGTVDGCTVAGNGLGVLATDGSNGNAFTDNEISANADGGFSVTAYSRGNALRRNRVTGNGGSGIRIDDGSSDPALVGNTVRDNDGGGIVLRELSGARIQGNRIDGNAGHGLRLSAVDGSRLTGNRVRRNGGEGIRLVDSTDTEAVTNVVRDNGDGRVVSGTSRATEPSRSARE